MAGRAPTDRRDPARATALLMPLATPAYRSGAAARTVAVSGATSVARPSENTVMPGRTPVQKSVPSPTGTRRSTPTAHSSGPIVIGRRGPIRLESAASREDRSSRKIVIGRLASPDTSGLKPVVTCSWMTRKKSTDASAP